MKPLENTQIAVEKTAVLTCIKVGAKAKKKCCKSYKKKKGSMCKRCPKKLC